MFESLKEELGKEILYSDHKKKSMHRVLENTLSRLLEKVEKNALFVFPIIYTRKAEKMRFDFGSLAFMDMDSFLADDVVAKLITNKEEVDDRFEDSYHKAWEAVKERAKHVVTVHLQGYELEKGKLAARSAVEFFLNVLRLSFKWDGELKIKVLDHNIQETMTPSFILLEGGKSNKSLYGASSEYIFLKDGVSFETIEALADYHHILSTIIDGMVRNSSSRSVVLQKIEYASFLIKTAFQQDSVRIALVNFVSALESLACLSSQSKKVDLSKRCQLVALDTSDKDREEISRVVFNAYNHRNNVVHGDAFDEDKYWRVFRDLEDWMLYLFLAYIDLLTHVEFSKRPKSGKKLRKALQEHFEEIDTTTSPNISTKGMSLKRCLKFHRFRNLFI